MASSTSPLGLRTDAGKQKDRDWVPNATYPERPDELISAGKVRQLMEHGIRRRRTIHLMGDHGIGKTSLLFEAAKTLPIPERLGGGAGLEVVYINLANITPDDKLANAPKKREDGVIVLSQMITADMVPNRPYMIVLDDARHASQKVQNQFMQLTCAWELGLHDLPMLALVVMADNEGVAEGIRTSEDPAVADRKVTIRLNANDTGWRYALARKFATTDLKGVFSVWDGLDRDLRHLLSPRCLEHVLYCATNGFPLIWGLPMMGGKRVRLATMKDNKVVDRTVEILDRIAAALGVPNRDSIPDAMNRVVDAAMRDNLTVLIQGPPGCGKTESVKQRIRDTQRRSVYYSMPFCDPEGLIVPMPTAEGTLESLIAEELLDPTPFTLVLDEANRVSSPAVNAKMMELTQQRSIGGVPLEGLRGIIALQNPPEWMGRKMNVTRNNLAQADRFTISMEVTPDDIAANEWLIEAYGSTAEVFLEWWKNDISEEHREWVTKRTLQRMIELHEDHMDLELGLIYLGEEERAPVPLIDLRKRLANRPSTALSEIASNVDDWKEKLRLSDSLSDVGSETADLVVTALQKAELSQLERHRDAIVQLALYVPQRLRTVFFTTGVRELTTFWTGVFREAMAAQQS